MSEQKIDEIAWAAGLFEGEGCMSPMGKATVTLYLGTTDLDVLETFQGIMGVGTITAVTQRSEKHKPHFVWRVSSAPEVRRILRSLLPFLHHRRYEKALEMLSRLENNRGPYSLRTECPHGHPYNEENTGMTNGRRRCRECNRAITRRWKKEQRMAS